MFFVPMLFVLGLLHAFVYRRIRRAFELPRAVVVGLVAMLIAGPLTLVAGRLLARGQHVGSGLYELLTVFGSIMTIGVLLTAAVLLPVAFAERLAGWGLRLRARLSSKAPSEPQAAPEAQVAPHEPQLASEPQAAPEAHASLEGALTLPRRRFLEQATTGSAMLIAGGSSIYGGLFGRHDYRIEEVPIVIRGLPRSLDGYTIAQLSDIHIGSFVRDAELRAAEALARKAKPDLVVLTGDLLDHDPGYAPQLGAFVRRLTDIGRDGVAAIAGNHDHYAGIREVLGSLRGAGADVLVNQGRLIGDEGGHFALLGVDDVWARREGVGGPDLDRALAMVPEDAPRVLLCHNPEFFLDAAERVDLQLSGHTHGGQVNFGINSASLVFHHGYVRGHYRRDSSQIYVNRGFGTAGPPSRIGSPPEVTKIVLVAG